VAFEPLPIAVEPLPDADAFWPAASEPAPDAVAPAPYAADPVPVADAFAPEATYCVPLDTAPSVSRSPSALKNGFAELTIALFTWLTASFNWPTFTASVAAVPAATLWRAVPPRPGRLRA